MIKLIDNLPNHLKDKTYYLLKLKDSIDILIACIKYNKYGHHVTKCGKKEKVKNEKIKIKQEKTDIKPVTIQIFGSKSLLGKLFLSSQRPK